ncbi:hypothetical protein PENTCL1PPCAC_76, partial [Pristionchus entomophagus]
IISSLIIMSISRLATVSTLLIAYVSANCDPGWRYLPSTQSCYKLLDDQLPWSVSEIRCLYQGGHHPSITSYEENQFVHETARHQEVWLGAAFFGSDYAYVNSDHTPFGYWEGWEFGGSRPSMNRARRCIKINNRGEWFQSCCKKLAVSVCKKAATPAWGNDNNLRH